MLKVALVGVGGISGCHIPTWESMEETELVALCDVRPERFEPYEGKRCYTDFDEMLEKEEIDILDICLPSYMHPEFSIKAMNKGINVLCEKPISLKKEDVAPIYEAAKRNNVKFMVAHVLRFWPEFDYVKQVVKSGKYGKVMSGFVQRLNHMPRTSWDGWMFDEKRSGFVPFDLHIHDLDFLVYTFGEPKDFSCKRVKTADSDYVNVMYDYGDFFIGGEASWYQQMSPFKAGFRFQFETKCEFFCFVRVGTDDYRDIHLFHDRQEPSRWIKVSAAFLVDASCVDFNNQIFFFYQSQSL